MDQRRTKTITDNTFLGLFQTVWECDHSPPAICCLSGDTEVLFSYPNSLLLNWRSCCHFVSQRTRSQSHRGPSSAHMNMPSGSEAWHFWDEKEGKQTTDLIQVTTQGALAWGNTQQHVSTHLILSTVMVLRVLVSRLQMLESMLFSSVLPREFPVVFRYLVMIALLYKAFGKTLKADKM